MGPVVIYPLGFFCSRFESLIYWATKILGLEEYGSNT